MRSQSLIGWWQPTINFIFYFHILLQDFTWKTLLRVRQWLKIDTQFCKQISVSFSQGILVLQTRWQCATRNTIFYLSLSFHVFVNLRLLASAIFYYWLLVFWVFPGKIPRLSFIQHSLYVGVVENSPSPTTHRGGVRNGRAEIPRRWSLPEFITSSGGL